MSKSRAGKRLKRRTVNRAEVQKVGFTLKPLNTVKQALLILNRSWQTVTQNTARETWHDNRKTAFTLKATGGKCGFTVKCQRYNDKGFTVKNCRDSVFDVCFTYGGDDVQTTKI